ncbi:hypothetical protein Q1695_012946 [Nippostrongylus brasiliensis]|nr:hypothetical protein Q1695_012946 [Nippostrongylus brasiliensis]
MHSLTILQHIRPGLHIGEMVHHSKPSRRFRKRGYRRFLRRRMRVAGDANVGRSEGWSGTRAFDSVPSLSPRDLQRTTIPTPVHKMPWMMPLKKKRPAVGPETLLGEDYSP